MLKWTLIVQLLLSVAQVATANWGIGILNFVALQVRLQFVKHFVYALGFEPVFLLVQPSDPLARYPTAQQVDIQTVGQLQRANSGLFAGNNKLAFEFIAVTATPPTSIR